MLSLRLTWLPMCLEELFEATVVTGSKNPAVLRDIEYVYELLLEAGEAFPMA